MDEDFPIASSCCTSNCGETCLDYDEDHTSLAFCESTASSVKNDGMIDIDDDPEENSLIVRNMDIGEVAVFRIKTPNEDR